MCTRQHDVIYRFVSHCCDVILLCIVSQISNKRNNIMKNESVPGFSLLRDAAYRLALSTDNSTNDVTRHQYPWQRRTPAISRDRLRPRLYLRQKTFCLIRYLTILQIKEKQPNDTGRDYVGNHPTLTRIPVHKPITVSGVPWPTGHRFAASFFNYIE